MDLIRSMHPMTGAWLLDGPLSPYFDPFQALLDRGQYADGRMEKALARLVALRPLDDDPTSPQAAFGRMTRCETSSRLCDYVQLKARLSALPTGQVRSSVGQLFITGFCA
jgi:hypothetical protein